jgi:hypothetical protein
MMSMETTGLLGVGLLDFLGILLSLISRVVIETVVSPCVLGYRRQAEVLTRERVPAYFGQVRVQARSEVLRTKDE